MSTSGIYFVTVSTPCGDEKDDINIGFSVLPNANIGSDTALCIKDFEISANPNYSDYLWSTGELSSIITVNEAGTYTVTITDVLGCVSVDTITIKDSCETNFFIPNAFTPNGDGKNDIFMPMITNVENYEFFVFNRWGQQIFYTKDQEKGWDGTSNGNESECAVYYYLIKYKAAM